MTIEQMMRLAAAEWQRERARTQMTLGGLIERLEALPADLIIEGFGEPHSYRGFYEDLAFERAEEGIPVWRALNIAGLCVGAIFDGYKGGDFPMHRGTPVWIAEWGSTGRRLMGITNHGLLETAEWTDAVD